MPSRVVFSITDFQLELLRQLPVPLQTKPANRAIGALVYKKLARIVPVESGHMVEATESGNLLLATLARLA